MEISRKELIQIVEQASTIVERLNNGFSPDEVQANDKVVDSLLKKWCQVCSGKEQFEKRLIWDGLDINTVRRVLGRVRLSDEQPLPVWVETFKEAMQSAASVSLEAIEMDNSGKYRCLDTQQPIPFEEVFLPFIQVAQQKLVAIAGSSYQLLPEAAHATLERNLLQQLARLGFQSLELEFSILRAFKQTSLDRLLVQLQGDKTREHYRDFIQGLLKNGLLSFFQEYSVLARLVATVTDFWVDATKEFLQRLALDWSAIQTTFQGDTDIGRVVEINPSLSDSHNQGRSVIALKFTSGLKLIYKPKNLDLEVAGFQLFAWFNQHEPPLPFKLLKVINRSTYGWVEYVEQLPCQNQEQAKRFYQRLGMLLCVLYVLEGTDCQYENLIANGEHPVLIDMETLMQHRIQQIEGQAEAVDAQFLVNQQIEESVLRTGLLPRWTMGIDGQVACDLSGLGGVGEQEMPFHIPTWKGINTDNMALEYKTALVPSQANVPTLNGVALSSSDYVDEIVNGFEQMYWFLEVHREAFLEPDSPLAAFSGKPVRFVFRDTIVYHSVLTKTLDPKFLRDGVERSIELDILSRGLLSSETKPTFWSLLKLETQALEQLDTPYFTARTDSDGLEIAPNQTLEEFFKKPSYSCVISRLQQLSDENLAQQITIIRGSLYSRFAHTFSNTLPAELEGNLDKVFPLTQEQLVQQAVAIAQELQQRGIYAPDGSVTWLGIVRMPKAQRLQLQPLDNSLYEGCGGVALFLASLATVTGRAEFGDLALGALCNLRKVIQNLALESQPRIDEHKNISGATGLGSIVYTLVQIAQFLGEVDLIKDAQQVASLMALEDNAVNQGADVLSGAAAAILSLLNLHKATSDPGILAQATAWGKHLLNIRVASNADFKVWATPDGKILTGFPHGDAGIAYALLRLYAATQDPIFLSAAEEAIISEHSVFDAVASNEPDSKAIVIDNVHPLPMFGCCHGASSTALARLGGIPILDTSEIRREIETALQTMQQSSLQRLDNLCCGNFGRIEVLMVASKKLKRPELLEIAQKQAAWVVDRAAQAGSFQLLANLPKEVYNPGFIQGTAGIGYQLLRLAHPNVLPSVLLW
jgi:type 2 lantibiotic biosynthesis protein LanM